MWLKWMAMARVVINWEQQLPNFDARIEAVPHCMKILVLACFGIGNLHRTSFRFTQQKDVQIDEKHQEIIAETVRLWLKRSSN